MQDSTIEETRPMISLEHDEDSGAPIIAIGTKEISLYFWLVAEQLTMFDEVILQATNNNMPNLIRVADAWEHFGIIEVQGSRKPCKTKNKRDGGEILVTRLRLRRRGYLK